MHYNVETLPLELVFEGIPYSSGRLQFEGNGRERPLCEHTILKAFFRYYGFLAAVLKLPSCEWQDLLQPQGCPYLPNEQVWDIGVTKNAVFVRFINHFLQVINVRVDRYQDFNGYCSAFD